MCEIININTISKYLQVNPGKLEFNNERKLVRTTKDAVYVGYSTILSSITREAKMMNYNRNIHALLDQWFDYSIMFVDPATKDKQTAAILLKDLNDHLSSQTYLVADIKSVADVSVFLAVTPIVQGMSLSEKERLIHLSRWYNNIQNQLSLRPNFELVNFSTLRLSAFERLSIGQ